MNLSLKASWDRYSKELDRISYLSEPTNEIHFSKQYLIAEMALIRATSLFETYLAEVSYKIACGALYVDGSAPKLIVCCRSMSHARQQMLTLNRPRQLQSLKWTKSSYIKDSVMHIIDQTDNYIRICDNYGSHIHQIFQVRNYAAHRSSSSRENYYKVVRQVYGWKKNIRLGAFLMSGAAGRKPNLDRYITEMKVIGRDLVKA